MITKPTIPYALRLTVRSLLVIAVEHEKWSIEYEEKTNFKSEYCPTGGMILDLILDMIGIPADNTSEAEGGACEHANETGVWPEWGYCRDSFYNEFRSMVVSNCDIDVYLNSLIEEIPFSVQNN